MKNFGYGQGIYFKIELEICRSLSSSCRPNTHGVSALANRLTLTYDLLTLGSTHIELVPEYTCTKFDVDSSCRFAFRAQAFSHRFELISI